MLVKNTPKYTDFMKQFNQPCFYMFLCWRKKNGGNPGTHWRGHNHPIFFKDRWEKRVYLKIRTALFDSQKYWWPYQSWELATVSDFEYHMQTCSSMVYTRVKPIFEVQQSKDQVRGSYFCCVGDAFAVFKHVLRLWRCSRGVAVA